MNQLSWAHSGTPSTPVVQGLLQKRLRINPGISSSVQVKSKETMATAGTWTSSCLPLLPFSHLPADRGSPENKYQERVARNPTGPEKEGLKASGQQEKQQRRKGTARDTELLCSKKTDCVGGSSPQTNLLFILLLWVAGPKAREVISGRDHSTSISYCKNVLSVCSSQRQAIDFMANTQS